MNNKQAYQITVTVDVSDPEVGGVLITAIEDALRQVPLNRVLHWFCAGEAVPFQVYQECECNALMAHDEQEAVLELV
jgi:hypothetical protein